MSRSILIISCDGNPYMFIQNILAKDIDKLYTWVVVVPGKFHVTYNMVKALIGLYYPFSIQDFASNCSHLRTLSKESVVNFTDYHRAKDLHLVQYFLAKAADIISMYKRDCTVESVDGFYAWATQKALEDYSFNVHYEQIFRYYFAVHLHHIGIRQNKNDIIRAADFAFAPLWFASKHPNYAKIQILTLLDEQLVTSKVKNLLDNFSVFSRTGTIGKFQGLDAYLEEIHKEATKFLPNSPTDEDWKRAFINLQYYLKLDTTLKKMNPKTTAYSLKRRKYPIRDIIYHRLMSYYHKDEEGNLSKTYGNLNSVEVSPEAMFTESCSTFRSKYIVEMIQNNNRILPVKCDLISLTKKRVPSFNGKEI
jgi:hypothetical protein